MSAALIAGLRDADRQVRLAAINAMGNSEAPVMIAPRMQAVRLEDAEMRQRALMGLARIKDRRAAEMLAGLWPEVGPDLRGDGADARATGRPAGDGPAAGRLPRS